MYLLVYSLPAALLSDLFEHPGCADEPLMFVSPPDEHIVDEAHRSQANRPKDDRLPVNPIERLQRVRVTECEVVDSNRRLPSENLSHDGGRRIRVRHAGFDRPATREQGMVKNRRDPSLFR